MSPIVNSYVHDAAGGRHARFTDHLWDRTKVVRDAIDELEFLRRLGDGTLPLEVFRTYIEQDFLYLTGYSKALSLVAAHAPDPESGGFWAGSAATAATVEASLHQNLLSGGQLPDSDGPPRHSQACLGYISYLTAVAATEPYSVATAAVLPCFWIYADVGRRLASSAREVLSADPSHPYAQWVTTYDAEEFHAAVATARELVDTAANTATDAQREAMTEAFVIASRYELLFWDTALNPQHWPAS